ALGRVSFLEQALWKQFAEATDVETFARAWLALQCTMITGATAGVVVLGEPDTGPFAPVAQWPIAGATNTELAAVAELALKERRGSAQGQDAAGSLPRPSHVAYPFIVDGRIHGVVAIELESGRRDQLHGIMRQLQWGVSWIEVVLRREQGKRDKAHFERMAR